MTKIHDSIRAIRWQDDSLYLLDQRLLPSIHTEIKLKTAAEVADAIQTMVVRGAPAIGIAAAYGVVLAANFHYQQDKNNWQHNIQADLQLLKNSRPTAVNLFWAIEVMQNVINTVQGDPVYTLKAAADKIFADDIQANYSMGKLGASLMSANSGAVLTHCNAGSLATGGFGTAIGVIRQAFMDGKIQHVYADETRPWMQGARLTAWELVQDNIPVTLQTEGAAASLMQQGKISWVIVGSDRIAANGDVANKIGTYGLAVLAHYHKVKFMVVAPTSTVDMSMAAGKDIPIEQRNANEVLYCGDKHIAATGADARNPAFDITPAALVDAIVTEKGIVEKPNREKMHQMMEND